LNSRSENGACRFSENGASFVCENGASFGTCAKLAHVRIRRIFWQNLGKFLPPKKWQKDAPFSHKILLPKTAHVFASEFSASFFEKAKNASKTDPTFFLFCNDCPYIKGSNFPHLFRMF